MAAPVNRSRFLLFSIVPVVALLVAFTASRSVEFNPPITPQEQALAAVAAEPLRIDLRHAPEVHGLASPFRTPSGDKAGYPETPLAEMAPGNAQTRSLTFILMNAERKIAIINGQVVREGDRFEGSRIARIEKTRVLVKGKGGQEWLVLQGH